MITGGGSGLGRALALRFAKLGTNIALLGTKESRLLETKKQIEKEFPRCLVRTYICDISDRQLVYKTADQISKDLGFVSILVNNAGVLNGKSILQLNDNNIINTFNVNTLGHFWTIRAFLPNMLTANKGHIVTIASICGKTGFVQMTDYCSSKHALIGLNESLRYELSMKANNKIQTTVVMPTFFKTSFINGVKPSFAISIFGLNRVADDVIDAVLKDEETLIIPKYFNILFTLKHIFPTKAMDIIYDLIGGHKMMNQFKGNH